MRIAVFAFLIAIGTAVHAGEVDDRAASVAALTQKIAALGGERQKLAQAYGAQAAAIADLKAQPSAWGRDRKLQTLLAESQTMAAALDAKDGELRAASGALTGAKRALLAAVDAELAGAAAPDADRRAVLERQRASLAAELAQPIRIADERIDPADDADDLDLKAGALAQSEKALLAEGERLDRRAAHFRRQARLVRSRDRADDQDVFREEEHLPGRGSARSTANSDSGPNPTTGATGGPTAFRPTDIATDPSLVLGGVLGAGTLDELRRAERSGDPDSLARAAELARKQVAERAARVHERRLEMQKRAQTLRGGP